MRKLQRSLLAHFIVIALCVAAVIPGASGVAAQSGDTSYTDDGLGVTIAWTDAWKAELPSAESNILTLERDSSIFIIVSIIDGQAASPEEAVWFLYQDGDEIIEDRSTETPAHLSISFKDTGLLYTVEAYSVNNGEATVLFAMGTVPVLENSALGIVQQDITINGTPALAGETIDDAGADSGDATPETANRTSRTSRSSTEPTDLTDDEADDSGRISRNSDTGDDTAEPTEEADATDDSNTGISRTSRTDDDSTETPEATEEATTEITRTSRTGSDDADETPVATEAPTAEPTEDALVRDDPGSYTGTVWGYSISYDTEVWERSNTFDNPTVDGVLLDGATATVSFVGTGGYGADPVACLAGENEYYGAESENISDWEVATDENGDQLWYESDELSWGVFTYTYHSSSGTDAEFVDYLSCETIPDDDAVLIVQMTSFPENYNTNLDAILDILDTLEFQP